MRSVLVQILALADELAAGTIERQLAKSDIEVGVEYLLRSYDPPRWHQTVSQGLTRWRGSRPPQRATSGDSLARRSAAVTRSIMNRALL